MQLFILVFVITSYSIHYTKLYETGDYTLVHVRTGDVVGGGFDGSGVIIVVIVRLLFCAVLLSLSPVLLPVFFVFDIIV